MSEGNLHQSTKSISSTARRRLYRIELRGEFDQGWVTTFDPLSFSSLNKVTTIEVLADQATLRGILNRLWDLNLDINSVVEIGLSAVRNGGK